MELLDLYDEQGNLINKTIVRGEKFSDSYIMLSIVFIKNNRDEFLIQKTSVQKGGEYSSTGGHVTHGEKGLEAIIREVKEELGIDIAIDELTFIALEKHPKAPCLINLYSLEKDINIDDIKIDHYEVESVSWMNKEEVLKLITDRMFIFSHGYLFQKYFK